MIVAFTGHRTYQHSAEEQLRTTILSLYNQGARTFRVGMAEGFDLAAAEAILEIMSESCDITLEAYIPWQGFNSHLTSDKQERYQRILQQCDTITTISEEFRPWVFRERNDRLVEGADYVVAWWDGSSSGTGYTVRKALKKRCKVVNLYPSQQLTMEL